MNQKWTLLLALAAGSVGRACFHGLSLVSVHAQVPSASPKDTPSVKFPTWGQVRQLFIRIPLEQSGAPFTVKGIVTDSDNAKVREFDDKNVSAPLFSKTLPALPPGTYRLKVAITDKDGVTKELDRFPPATVIQNYPQELSHTTEPIVISKTEPQYTKEALAAKIEGDVILSMMIGTDGVPSDIKLVRGLGMGLDENAVECLKQWRFRPATNHSEPVSAKVTVEMNFRMPRSSNSK